MLFRPGNRSRIVLLYYSRFSAHNALNKVNSENGFLIFWYLHALFSNFY